MALPVVISPNGIPVSAAPSPFGLPVTVSNNGFGLAVTPVASGGRPVFDTGGTLFGPPVAPANTVPPVITGTTVVGNTLLTSSGTWSGTAATYTYQWKRGGVAISGATSSAYLLVSADIGTMISVTVTATNTAGNASATATAVGPVTALSPPANAGGANLPVVSGTPAVGQVLTATTGTWTGSPPITYAYQWQRVSATLPVNTAAPAITGSTLVGSTLTLSNGTWTGSPTPTYTYQWKRNGTNISGATASTYLLVSADLTTTITATVTATNTAGAVGANAAGVGPITAPVVTTTLDPAFVNATGNTLSPDKLTVTCTSDGQWTVRSLAGHATGKYYWEVTITDDNNIIAGICSSTMVSNTYISSDARSGGPYAGSGWISGFTGTTTSDTANLLDTYCFALDATNKTVWVKKLSPFTTGFWNANATADPATNTNGANFSSLSDMGTANVYAAFSAGGSGDSATFNFGATAYAGTPPAGFGNM